LIGGTRMVREIPLYVGAAAIFVWGVAHLMATRPIVHGFGPISLDNRRVIAMEWIVEGVALCGVGLLVSLVTILEGPDNPAAVITYRVLAGMLAVFAGITALTGSRTTVLPMKMCPFIDAGVAVLFVLGST